MYSGVLHLSTFDTFGYLLCLWACLASTGFSLSRRAGCLLEANCKAGDFVTQSVAKCTGLQVYTVTVHDWHLSVQMFSRNCCDNVFLANNKALAFHEAPLASGLHRVSVVADKTSIIKVCVWFSQRGHLLHLQLLNKARTKH